MTELLYLHDHYLKEFDATILEIPDSKSVVLDRTALYPRGGGQPADRGVISLKDGTKNVVVDSSKEGERVIHVIAEPIPSDKVGERVHCSLDWPLRYLHMRYHTALHILSGVVFLKFGARIIRGTDLSGQVATRFQLGLPRQ